MANIKISEWQKAFDAGNYDSPDRKTQIDAGWYDWFCRDSSLVNKTKKMGQIIKGIKNGGKVDLEKNYIFFKNNCPLTGPLYDDFRICDLETSKLLFTIQIDCCWSDCKYTVYGLGQWDKPIFKTNLKKELLTWLNSK